MGRVVLHPPGSGQPFVSGTYTGDGQASQFINLGFTPSAVITWHYNGEQAATGYSPTQSYYGGMATKDFPCCLSPKDRPTRSILAVEAGGFRVYFDSAASIRANEKTYIYNNNTGNNELYSDTFFYIALR